VGGTKEGALAAPIRIGTLDASEASELVQALAARGLIGRQQAGSGPRWVEVLEAHEDTDRLLADVAEAVSTWLGERERPSLEIRVEGAVHTVTPEADLREVLRARIPARKRRSA
jgi:hypothetical protein